MSAEVTYKLRLQVQFDCDMEWDAVTGDEAKAEFMATVAGGAIDVGDMDLDTTRMRIVVVGCTPA